MVGYMRNNKTGAALYNLFHTYCLPAIMIISGVLFTSSPLLMAGLIWTAHIGMDRMLGYGLKYPSHFKDTHLNLV
ncbi:DUF4260 domain-containing protein [Bacillus tamaricis]|uniref:DUF4260 domain-containing protein n=1 Tax=Evansella tamaricis TaxID=2069301 RepID=A0ABS6JIM8_9BACI|nr:DUF4260 domain-containing protein [Evansella tamaricis]